MAHIFDLGPGKKGFAGILMIEQKYALATIRKIPQDRAERFRERQVHLPNGLCINYMETGPANGPVVMLTHGFLGSWQDWRYNLEALSRQSFPVQRVIAFDWPGFGKSSKPTQNYSLAFFTETLKLFADSLNIASFDLIGHSMGGKYSLSFALEYPRYLRRLVLVAPDGWADDPWWAAHTERSWFNLLLKRGLPLLGDLCMLRLLYNRVFFDSRFQPTYSQLIRQARLYRQPQQLAALYAMTRSYGVLGFDRTGLTEGGLQCPTLLVWGKQDLMVAPKTSYQMLNLLPGAALFLFDECGHMPQIEKARKFNELVLTFLHHPADLDFRKAA